MNKRKRKKARKKQELFITSFVSSYKELKKFDRMYHEYVVEQKRKRINNEDYDSNWDMWLEDFEDYEF